MGAVWSCFSSSEAETSNAMAMTPAQITPPLGRFSTTNDAIVSDVPPCQSEQQDLTTRASVPQTSPVPNTESPPSKRQIAISSLKLALGLAEKALDGLPIPGAKGTIGGVLKLIEQTETANSNVETLKKLGEHVSVLRAEVLGTFNGLEEHALPTRLGIAMDRFSSELSSAANRCATQIHEHGVTRWVLATKNQEDLAQFADNVQRATGTIQIALSFHNALSNARIEEGIDQVRKLALWNRVDQLPHAWYAAYDSERADTNATCLAGTRETILRDIMSWIEHDHQAKEPNVLWLKGAAGIGKSTIARTIAMRANEAKMLGASFFFTRGTKDLEDVGLMIPTLAFHLARLDGLLKSAIGQALVSYHGILEAPAATQLQTLIIEPLGACFGLSSSHRLLFVLDALDECSNHEKLLVLTKDLVSSLKNLPYVRLLLTSRPEHPIQSSLHKIARHRDLAEDANVRADIRSYIDDGLRRISTADKNQDVLPPDGSWPAEADQKALVERSGSLFVYAATALRYIDAQVDPPSALRTLLAAGNSRGTKAYKRLDELYMQVLTLAFPVADMESEALNACRTILAILVFAREPMDPAALEAFSGAAHGIVRTALVKLRSVVESEMGNGKIRIYHPSFRDFLVDPIRQTSPAYALERSGAERALTLRCLALLGEAYKRDAVDAVEHGSYQRGQTMYSPELGYACRFWCEHLCGVIHGDAGVSKQLMVFASHHLLYWIEVMVWLYRLEFEEIRSALISAHSWTAAAADAGTEDLLHLLWDAIAWVSLYDYIYKMPVHQEALSLSFTPRHTSIYTTYHDALKQWIQVVSGAEIQWPTAPSFAEAPDVALDKIGDLIDDHLWTPPRPRHSKVHCVVFTSDGSIFATGEIIGQRTPRGSITVWKTEDGSHLRTLQTWDDQSSAARSLAFSADGKTLASSHADWTLCLWDVETGCLELKKNLKFEVPIMERLPWDQDVQRLQWEQRDKQLVLSTPSFVHTLDVDGHSPASGVLGRGVRSSARRKETNPILRQWQRRGKSNGVMLRVFKQMLMMKKSGGPRWTVACVVPNCFPVTCAGLYGNRVVVGARGGAVIVLDVSGFTGWLEHHHSIPFPLNSSSHNSSSASNSSIDSILRSSVELDLSYAADSEGADSSDEENWYGGDDQSDGSVRSFPGRERPTSVSQGPNGSRRRNTV